MASTPDDSKWSALARLAHLHGVQTGYWDITGAWQESGSEAVQAVLRALGVEAEDPARAEEATRRRMDELDARILPPVTVVEVGASEAPPELLLRLPPEVTEHEVICALVTEDGYEMEWRARPERLEPTDAAHRVGARIRFEQPIPSGYHDLTVTTPGLEATTRVIAAPPTSWRPAEDPEEERYKRDWGVFLPLYALRSESSWGTGNLSDLRRLLEWMDELGGQIVGTLPMLAADNRTTTGAPVYNPVSRLFWNEVYLDVENIPELQESPSARRLLESSEFRAQVRDLREDDHVNWARALEAKRAVLERMARDVLRDGLPERIRRFLEHHPDAEQYARFRATWDTRHEPWGAWPDELRRPLLDAGSGDEEHFRYHLFVQWLADREMHALKRGESAAGLYLDLPLGCHPDGFDVWRHQELFAENVAVGAPPDDFFTKGQNWGFPALRPDRMEESGLAYTIASLRHHMRFASRLRLDHVMGFHRLFWIPGDMGASQGVYVHYPAEALHAALRIESHRHRTALVGEDLGTVPDEVRQAMARDRIERMYVAQIEARPSDPALGPPPERSVYSLNTHDTPTFAGFWAGDDIDDRLELGLVDEEEAEELHRTRGEIREAWTGFLRDEGEASQELASDEPEAVLEATLRKAARTPASLLLVTLEDLWLERRPQNVPGTGPERPNFRRKATMDLEEVVGHDGIRKLLRELSRLREGPAPGPAGSVPASGTPATDPSRSPRRTAP